MVTLTAAALTLAASLTKVRGHTGQWLQSHHYSTHFMIVPLIIK